MKTWFVCRKLEDHYLVSEYPRDLQHNVVWYCTFSLHIVTDHVDPWFSDRIVQFSLLETTNVSFNLQVLRLRRNLHLSRAATPPHHAETLFKPLQTSVFTADELESTYLARASIRI